MTKLNQKHKIQKVWNKPKILGVLALKTNT